MNSEISKQDLYDGVKALVDNPANHIHLPQHKLFTLFSIGFQYFLFNSTKEPGAYIIRIEDSLLADKLCKKAKDQTSRKFLQSLMLPRKLKYGKSMFYLDYFHIGTWNLTKDIPRDKIKGALIVKNTTTRPMNDLVEVEDEADALMQNLPKNYYLSSLTEFVPRTITIAFDEIYEELSTIEFPFIKKDAEKTISGVTLGKDVSWDNID